MPNELELKVGRLETEIAKQKQELELLKTALRGYTVCRHGSGSSCKCSNDAKAALYNYFAKPEGAGS